MKNALGLVSVGALIGVAPGILVSVATDIPFAPEVGRGAEIGCSSIALGAARFDGLPAAAMQWEGTVTQRAV
jgi:hypothetical protein